jgi:hypothetical protein
MSPILKQVRSRPKFAAVALLGYLTVAGIFLMLVGHESDVWRVKRQKLIEESPAVWVAPYGAHYHEEWHYGRRLSSPISLYEATEGGYKYCDVCHPPGPAKLIDPPVWVRHWVVALASLSCLWVIPSALMLYKPWAASNNGARPTPR